MGVTTDLKILWREARYLPFIANTNEEDKNGPYNETGLLTNIPTSAKLVLGVLTGIGSLSETPQIERIGELKKTSERWFFVNGICTDLTVFRLNCKYLSEIFGTQITGMWNPTRGITIDLIECATGRTFDFNEPFTMCYAGLIENALQGGHKVKLIGHSQGGIIVSNIIRYLSLKRKDFSNLEVYTFASAADGEQSRDGLFQEHFGNENDFVHRIGLGASEYKPKTLWRRNGGNGHLLNLHYLNAFKSGKFCGKKSKLFANIAK